MKFTLNYQDMPGEFIISIMKREWFSE